METERHTDPMFRSRECRTCHVWLPCCVIDDVAEHASEHGMSNSDVVLAALRAYLGGEVADQSGARCGQQ